MCITKSGQDIAPLFDKHVKSGLEYSVVSQKQSNWDLDITTKKVLNELDSSK